MTQYFVSDTHFCEFRPEHIEAFGRLMRLPQQGDQVVLLGDIFEIWVTDDLALESDLQIEAILSTLHRRGVELFFMHGNRDFMVGKQFRARTGCRALKDPCLWTLADGRQCVLTHGDYFCTDDEGYRRFRRVVRNPVFQFFFRHLPKSTRLGIANKIRQSSIKAHKEKGNLSYDASDDLINSYFCKFAPIDIIIMGHTHLPNLHRQAEKRRLVLGDWRETLWYASSTEDNGVQLFESDLDLHDTQLRHQF